MWQMLMWQTACYPFCGTSNLQSSENLSYLMTLGAFASVSPVFFQLFKKTLRCREDVLREQDPQISRTASQAVGLSQC
jgi:hypothetical protein